MLLSSTKIQVSWTEVEPINQNGVIIQYEIMYNSSFELEGSVFTNGSTLMVIITGLEEDTDFNVSVRAYTSVGPGPFSVGVMKKTEEDGLFLFI